MAESRGVAVVTGAGSGIGKASVLALAGEGYACVLAGRRKEPLESVAAEIADLGSKAIAVPTDVGNPDSVTALFAAAKSAFGRVDVVFNNAGITAPPAPIEDVAFADWQAVVDANLNGLFLCAQAAYRVMKAQDPQGGRIINNGSISATTPRPNAIAYNATKHGVTGITKSIALEGRPYSIACGQIDIGNAATDMTQKMTGGVLQADGSLATEPRMDVKAVADGIVYMASLPLDANVLTMTVMATNMPFVGRG
ncbi:SDR family oxidoreductase [Bauldia sp.]|uniref:SDR family oxidoreductase n=1 Tax=Bauldia sp. TaxID=2575872 RepID=UPI003BA97BF3